MMIGSGMPISQSSAPFPKVMVASITLELLLNLEPAIEFHREKFETPIQNRAAARSQRLGESPILPY